MLEDLVANPKEKQKSTPLATTKLFKPKVAKPATTPLATFDSVSPSKMETEKVCD
jgi:hypothetical protein